MTKTFNKYGHHVITVVGEDFTGGQEVKKIGMIGYWSRAYLTCRKNNSYNKKHRLISGQEYKVVLVPSTEIHERSNLINYCKINYGYKKPLAGIIPRLREIISYEKVAEGPLIALHDPVEGRGCSDLQVFGVCSQRASCGGAGWDTGKVTIGIYKPSDCTCVWIANKKVFALIDPT